jgi:class 3 adenylate cyclase
LFRKYAPDPIAQAISAGDDPSAKTPRRQRRVLLFTDIMSFSAISEALAPARTLTWVNAVLCAAIECVVHHGGVVLSLMGDAVFASFDVDVLGETEACLGAVRAALAIQSALARMRAMSSSSADDDDSPLKVTYAGVGIHMGNVFVGNIGHKDKLAFTCMGNDVNVCARLETATRSKNAWVLATDTVFDVIRQFDDEFHMLFMGHETFRNIDQPYGLYAIESPNAPAAERASVSTTAAELPKDVKPRIMEWVERKKASRQKPLPKNMDAEDFSQFALQTTSAEDDEPMRSPLPLHELQEAFKAFQDKHRQEMRHSVN